MKFLKRVFARKVLGQTVSSNHLITTKTDNPIEPYENPQNCLGLKQYFLYWAGLKCTSSIGFCLLKNKNTKQQHGKLNFKALSVSMLTWSSKEKKTFKRGNGLTTCTWWLFYFANLSQFFYFFSSNFKLNCFLLKLSQQ